MALRRVSDGRFDVAQSLTLATIENDGARVRPAADAVAHLPSQVVDDAEAQFITHGRTVDARVDGERAALMHGGQLLAIGVREGSQWRPKVVMRDA